MSFTCICGKTYENIQAFRGHKSHCVKHLTKTNKLSLREEIDKTNGIKHSFTAKTKKDICEKAKAKEWLLQKHTCERCGKVMTSKYASGRFCSSKCAHSRKQTEETKEKIKSKITTLVQNGTYSSFDMHQKCINNYNKNPNKCIICGNLLPYEKRDNKTCSSQCKNKLLSHNSSIAAKLKGGNLNPYGVRGKAKYGTYKNIHCDSSWELAFVIFHLDNSIPIKRNTEGFVYFYEGKEHLYYPDFIVKDEYIEIKNYISDVFSEKQKHFPKDKKLIVISKKEIQFYLNFCKKKYGKDFTKLYDVDKPSWFNKI